MRTFPVQGRNHQRLWRQGSNACPVPWGTELRYHAKQTGTLFWAAGPGGNESECSTEFTWFSCAHGLKCMEWVVSSTLRNMTYQAAPYSKLNWTRIPTILEMMAIKAIVNGFYSQLGGTALCTCTLRLSVIHPIFSTRPTSKPPGYLPRQHPSPWGCKAGRPPPRLAEGGSLDPLAMPAKYSYHDRRSKNKTPKTRIENAKGKKKKWRNEKNNNDTTNTDSNIWSSTELWKWKKVRTE